MLRWSGLLAVAVSLLLVGLLWIRTGTAEVVGTILEPPRKRLPGVFGDRPPDGWLTVHVGIPISKPPTWQDQERLLNGGLRADVIDVQYRDGSAFWMWEVEIPGDV